MDAIPSELSSAAGAATARLGTYARQVATQPATAGATSQAAMAGAARQAVFADALLAAIHARLEELKGVAK